METQVHGFAFGLDDGFFTTPAAVELSVWIWDGGFFQPISIHVWRTGAISLAIMYSAPSYASAAEYITNLMIW